MNRSTILDVLGYSPDQIAEAELIKLAQDTNAARNKWVKQYGTFDGFEQWYATQAAQST